MKGNHPAFLKKKKTPEIEICSFFKVKDRISVTALYLL